MLTIESTTDQLYLSRLRLNPISREVMRSVSNSQRMHTLLLRGFPIGDRDVHNMLYRLEPGAGNRDEHLDIIVQSTIEPDWAFLRHEGLLLHESEFFSDGLVKNVSSLPKRLETGDVFRFRLRANPTKRFPWRRWAEAHPEKARVQINRARKKNPDVDINRLDGPRTAVTDYSVDKLLWERKHPGEIYVHPESSEEILLGWLRKQGDQHGFETRRTDCRPDPVSGDMQHGEKADKSKLAHKAILFEGLLRITDIDAFRSALIHGIGSGKAYGFGLLSLAPVRSGP